MKDVPPTSADGAADQEGAGRSLGIPMHEFELGEPFELGASGSFTVAGDGRLYLRCRDAWNGLADNNGTLTVRLKVAGPGSKRPQGR